MTSVSTEVPSGWVASKFTELTVRESTLRTPRALKATYKETGRFPVVDQGQEMVAGFTDDEELRFRGHLPVIVFGDHTRVFKFVDFPFVAGADGTRLIAPSRNRIDVRFFYYALFNLPLRNLGYSRHFKLLKEQMVRIPENLPEQRKIAAILSSVDDAIEKTQAVIDQVQVVKRGLMRELLTRGVPGRHTSFVQTAVGPIPGDWQVLTIGELGHDPRTAVRTGPFGSSMKTKDFRASGVPVITIQSLGEGTLNSAGLFFVSQEKADELSEYSVEEGDLVFSRVADIGRSLSVDASQSGYLISPNLMRIRPDRRKVDARFLMYAITLANGVLRQINSFSGKAGRPVVSSSILRRLCIPTPPLVEQREIARAGRRLESRISTEMASLALLKELKTALMSVLLTGEVRVTPDSNAA